MHKTKFARAQTVWIFALILMMSGGCEAKKPVADQAAIEVKSMPMTPATRARRQ
jgi:hypothetical protein